jgi:hypothetical protein
MQGTHRFKISSLVIASALVAACGDDGMMVPEDGGAAVRDAGTQQDSGQQLPTMEVEGEISSDTTWSSETRYILTDKVFVTGGATLTVEEGTLVQGDPGAALLVTRGSQIDAQGSADDPIVFTSSRPQGTRTPGDWAGVALLGGAPINVGSENNIEGIDPSDSRGLYGGDNADHNCGTLEYVRIEWAGDEFSPDNELNGLTVGGCGRNTTIEHVQVHGGLDDGIEFFGGTTNMRNIVITGANDDSLDWDQGWRGKVQHLIIQQTPGVGDNGFESDNNGDSLDATPRSRPKLANVTMVGHADTRGMKLREGTWGMMWNFIIMNFGTSAIDVIDEETAAGAEQESPELFVRNSLFFDIGSDGMSYFPAEPSDGSDEDDDGGFDESTFFMQSKFNNMFGDDPMLGDPANTTNPDFAPASGSPAAGAGVTPDDDFFEDVDYAGAVEPGATPWTEGWTNYPAN